MTATVATAGWETGVALLFLAGAFVSELRGEDAVFSADSAEAFCASTLLLLTARSSTSFKSNLDVIASGYSLLPTSRMSTLSPGFAKPETPVMSLIVKETALIPLGIIPAKPLAVWLLILRVVTTSPLRIATDDVFPTTPFISLIAAAGTASEGTLDTLTISLVISVYGGIS